MCCLFSSSLYFCRNVHSAGSPLNTDSLGEPSQTFMRSTSLASPIRSTTGESRQRGIGRQARNAPVHMRPSQNAKSGDCKYLEDDDVDDEDFDDDAFLIRDSLDVKPKSKLASGPSASLEGHSKEHSFPPNANVSSEEDDISCKFTYMRFSFDRCRSCAKYYFDTTHTHTHTELQLQV